MAFHFQNFDHDGQYVLLILDKNDGAHEVIPVVTIRPA
jgi:hypothetical protein